MTKTIRCSRCQNEIGQLVSVDGTRFLQVGGAIAREFHGVCASCGMELHWSVKDQEFARLMVRARQQEDSVL